MIRWVKSKKLAVLAEIKAGATDEDIFSRYGVQPHETKEWANIIERHGEGGLRVTKTTLYRDKEKEIPRPRYPYSQRGSYKHETNS